MSINLRRDNVKSESDEKAVFCRKIRLFAEASTHFFEDGTGGAAATTEASAKHQTRVRSCGCAVIFLHQRNEWHNEATSTYVRVPSVALPVGLCRRQKGETREEGGHALDMFALTNITAKQYN